MRENDTGSVLLFRTMILCTIPYHQLVLSVQVPQFLYDDVDIGINAKMVCQFQHSVYHHPHFCNRLSHTVAASSLGLSMRHSIRR